MPRPPLPPSEPMKLEALAEVARGGMGSVELSRVTEGARAGEILAVKRLHAAIAEDPEFVAMFLDEAWITAALKHPNVAQVIAWGNDEAGTYLAIELVQGVSLSRLLKESQTNQEPFAERTVAYICSGILGGLTAAHSLTGADGSPLGVVHRDLTPANVLVSFAGDVKIIDFGIAKAEERITHTRTGQLKGKPSYMAPEQQRGAALDHRADIFSFGVLMFELLAGRRPWTAKGAFDVMMEIANDPHPDLGELRKGLNPEFVAIAHKCLEKKPEARFQSAGEIKARLDAWLEAKGFASDDKDSLAHFVQRNSLPQMKWWEEALRGEHNKKKAPTFKELEEKIDEEREKKRKAALRAQPPPRPAAGAAPSPGPASGAPSRTSGTVPMAAYPGPSSQRLSVPNPPPSHPGGPPSSGQVPPSSGPAAALSGPTPPSGPVPPSSGHAGARISSIGPPVSYPPGAAPSVSQLLHAPGAAPPPSSQPALALAGTEYMAVSPAVGMNLPPPSAPPPPAPFTSSAGTEYMAMSPVAGMNLPVSPGPQAAPPAAPSGPPAPFSQRWGVGSGPTSTPVPGSDPALRQSGIGLAPPSAPFPPPSSAPAPAPRRSRAALVALALVLPVLAAAAAGAWFFRDEILNLGAPGGTKAAPAHPAGKR